MNGVLNILKPPAMTSSDVVSHVRRILAQKKVGHTGTLDPGAAGVLPVCIGRATKIADYIMRGDKEYIAEIAFGAETDTQDSYGNVVHTCECDITREALASVLPDFTGRLWQKPPMYSAVKHEGRKLYQLARKGITVEKPPREVYVHELELLGGERNRFLLRIRCSKGTYIRTLCTDVGKALSCYAHTSFLMRTETCGIRIEDAYTLPEIEMLMRDGDAEKAVQPMEQALSFLETLRCDPYLYRFLTTGTPVDLAKARLKVQADVNYVVYCGNELIGIGKKEGDTLKIVSMLKELGEPRR
ncbi:tRNA pseudouridine(55) synthase TruB [Christensenella intestinihominis]|uniref:tRNA pseudouridine(55) synthase TruB n=2 Tax=Christensenella intestinihominis TaxID=1851429 RepID=UPI00082B9551|nr:tRNA pseudouridine(55) synthase TruB [Christensenella intestinihominis]